MSATDRRYAPVIEDDAELGATLGGGAAVDHDADHERSASAEVEHHKKPSRSSSSDARAMVLARDSDAVVSVFYPEQRWIGRLLSTEYGGSSWACWMLQAVCVGKTVAMLLTFARSQAMGAGMTKPNALLYVTAVVGGSSWLLLALVIRSAPDALRSDGALEQLKVGEVMISEKDDATLSRWRVGMGVLSALWFLIGLLLLAGAFGQPPFGNSNESREIALAGLSSVRCERRANC